MKEAVKRSGLAVALGLAVAATGGMYSGTAHAQLVDYMAFGQRLQRNITDALNWIKTAQSYASQVQYYKTTYEQYRQQLINAQRMLTAGQQMAVEFKEVDMTEGMQEACGEASFTNQMLQSVTGFNMEGDVVAEQRKVCKAKVANQNAKHNEVVKWMKDTADLQKEYVRVLQNRDTVNKEEGKLAANTNELTSLLTKMQNREAYMRTRMAAYDSNIAMLDRTQALLGRKALHGSQNSSPFGSVLN